MAGKNAARRDTWQMARRYCASVPADRRIFSLCPAPLAEIAAADGRNLPKSCCIPFYFRLLAVITPEPLMVKEWFLS
jgi:hypothetical protein